MKLVTRRMTVMTLTPEQVKLLSENIPALEKDLTIRYRGEPMEVGFREIVSKQAKRVLEDEDNYIWHTFWMYHLDRELIGSAHFKGAPDSLGTVEIGFGINYDYKNQGYTTEAVKKITSWVLTRGGAKCITAKMKKNNEAAQRVLEKCGFEKFKEIEDHYYYKKDEIREDELWVSPLVKRNMDRNMMDNKID